MKRFFHLKNGYILFLTMSVLAIGTIIVTQIFYLGGAYNLYVPLMYERERAKQLALSGISIATAQLLLQDKYFYSSKTKSKDLVSSEKKSENSLMDNNPQKDDLEQNRKNLLKTLLLVNNQWQEFNLSNATDGFDGIIKICITCEDGKVNINKMYNSSKKSFYLLNSKVSTEGMIKVLSERMRDFFKDVDIETIIINSLKKQKQKYITPMDLFLNKNFSFFSKNIFYEPLDRKIKDNKNVQDIYLTDLFTTYSDNFYIDPWLMSNSLKLLLGFDIQKKLKKEDIETMLEKINLKDFLWEQMWDTTLKELYGKEFKTIPSEITPFLSTKFEPKVFSVLCYGKVGRIEQKLLAILERSSENKVDVVMVKKIYWL